MTERPQLPLPKKSKSVTRDSMVTGGMVS